MSANDYLLTQEYFRKMSQESGFQIETQQFAEYLQNIDELKYIRQEFHYPKNKTLHGVDLNIINGEDECIYLCGNSLGLCPKSLRSIIDEEITKWQECGVQGHHYGKRPWEHIDAFVIDQTAALVGAKPIEVVSMDSLTTNLHLLMVPFYRPTLSRHKILFEEGCFPSDRALIESQICFHGYDPKTSMLQAAPREGEYLLRTEDILQLIHEQGDSIALILFSGVQYKTGQYFDLKAITEAGHHKGCKVGFDLAHAVGNVELKLHDWNVDFAAWCTYKYLNAGPGSIGGLFIHERYAYEKDLKRFSGWWGVEFKERFHMDNNNLPLIPGARGFTLSNPCVLAVVSLFSSLEIFHKVGIEKIIKKQRLLTGYLEYLIKYKFGSDINNSSNHSGIFISIITPENLTSRGSQLSLAFSCNGTEIFSELQRRGVVCDFRQPNVMRVAPAPLYNSFVDVHKFVSILTEVVMLLKK
ncbi:kynureninase isoform X3 [Hydra vulgaris]|uniref:Kynureninase n=1 Tax=Hydra vulgaris TaxID=6087 RepID=A0ABM4BR32_HYDVU